MFTDFNFQISNRKLSRLVFGIAVSVCFICAYLVYSDIYHAQVTETRYHNVDPWVDFPAEINLDRNLHHDIKHPLNSEAVKTNLDILSNFEKSKSTLQIIPVIYHGQHSSTSVPLSQKKHSQIPQNSKLHKDPTNVQMLSNGHVLPQPNIKDALSSVKLNEGIPAQNEITKSGNVGENDLTRTKKDNKRYLIYLCHSENWCGGWGDRQRGMTATYFLSKAVDRKFKIIMTTPCGLSKFYKPHRVNWVWNGQTVSNTSFVINDISSRSNFRSLFSNGDFNKLFPQQVVFIKTNHDYYSLLLKNPVYTDFVKKQKMALTKRGRFRWAWGDMMQPSQYLLQKLQNVVGSDTLISRGLLPRINVPGAFHEKDGLRYQSTPSPLICAHIRMGRNPTIPMDEDFDSFRPGDIPKLIHFLQSKDKSNHARFFVATDYEGVRIEFRKVFGDRLIDYGGKILHIDRQRSERNACIGFEVALLDQLILSICDVLVVSRSGFSIHASHVSNSTERAYIMEDGMISPLKV